MSTRIVTSWPRPSGKSRATLAQFVQWSAATVALWSWKSNTVYGDGDDGVQAAASSTAATSASTVQCRRPMPAVFIRTSHLVRLKLPPTPPPGSGDRPSLRPVEPGEVRVALAGSTEGAAAVAPPGHTDDRAAGRVVLGTGIGNPRDDAVAFGTDPRDVPVGAEQVDDPLERVAAFALQVREHPRVHDDDVRVVGARLHHGRDAVDGVVGHELRWIGEGLRHRGVEPLVALRLLGPDARLEPSPLDVVGQVGGREVEPDPVNDGRHRSVEKRRVAPQIAPQVDGRVHPPVRAARHEVVAVRVERGFNPADAPTSTNATGRSGASAAAACIAAYHSAERLTSFVWV